jgi:hypothetical protein
VRLAINFPGLKTVLNPGADILYQPEVKGKDYGQGQFLLCDASGAWNPAGGMRWIQLDNARTLWFIVPHYNDPNLVMTRGISEQVPTAEEIKQAKEDEAKKAKENKLVKNGDKPHTK